MKHCLITNDVETFSLWNHCLSDETGEKVLKEGMPILLELYEKYNVKATFFYTGHIARLFPEIVEMILPCGHEVGCHGLVHSPEKAFDVLTYEQQVRHLEKSRKILEDISGREVISFRAPALRVNRDTPRALLSAGFKIDSSVASRRADMMFSFGAMKKLHWLAAPRKPYFASRDNLALRGESDLFEIPLSAFILPYTGTFMRISPLATAWLRALLDCLNAMTRTPVVFLIHPNELIYEKIIHEKIKRRAGNYISYLLGDVARYRLKLKNLGERAAVLFERELRCLSAKRYEFITLGEFYNRYAAREKSEAPR